MTRPTSEIAREIVNQNLPKHLNRTAREAELILAVTAVLDAERGESRKLKDALGKCWAKFAGIEAATISFGVPSKESLIKQCRLGMDFCGPEL